MKTETQRLPIVEVQRAFSLYMCRTFGLSEEQADEVASQLSDLPGCRFLRMDYTCQVFIRNLRYALRTYTTDFSALGICMRGLEPFQFWRYTTNDEDFFTLQPAHND